MFRCDCKVFDCISSKSEQNWCFVLVDGVLAFVLVLTCGVILYIIHILLLLYPILLYITIIISYTILFSSVLHLSSSSLPPLLTSFLFFLFQYSFSSFPILFYSFFLSSHLRLLIPSSSSSYPLIHSISRLKGIHIYLMFKGITHLQIFILYLSVLTYTYLYYLPIYLIFKYSTPNI